MKLVFNNYELTISTHDRFIENEVVDLLVYENIKPKEEKHVKRKVRFDNESGDLYILFKGKKYFYSEFK